MSGGRPTKYTPELIEKAHEYLETYLSLDQVIPSVEGLAVFLKIRRSTIYDWAKDEEKQEFSDILGEILEKQGQLLINSGLTGAFTPTISKLILTKHGYSDKVEQQHTGQGGGPVEVSWNVHPVRPIDPKKESDANLS